MEILKKYEVLKVEENAIQWPSCLHFHKVTEFDLPLKPVEIGTTLSGVETRQKVSDVARGAEIKAELRWIEADGPIEEFYEFLINQAEGSWKVFRLDESDIGCLIPGWDYYRRYLPSQYWRFQTGDRGQGFPVRPNGCCMIDVDVVLINVIEEQSTYNDDATDEQWLRDNLGDPFLTLPGDDYEYFSSLLTDTPLF